MIRRLAGLAVSALLVAACSSTTVVYVTPAPTSVGFGLPISLATAAPSAPQASSSAGTGGNTGGNTGGTVNGLPLAVAATVQVFMYANANDAQPLGWGSGTIISANGFILTNSHVASPDAPGLAVQYGGPVGNANGKMVVAISQAEDKPPVPMYQASLKAVDGYLDVAVIQIDKTIDGKPVDPSTLNLPFMKVGDSDQMHIGDRVTIVGFPGIGGDTVTEDTGDVSGFISDERIGDRAWIKTSAIVYHGNSGGLAENANGELIGIPTRAPDFAATSAPGGYSLLRASKWALPVIQAAESGQNYGSSKYVVPATGQEQVQIAGWLDPADTGCASADPHRVLAAGVQRLGASVSWSGLAANEDVLFLWLQDQGSGAKAIYRSVQRWTGGPSGSCLAEALTTADGFPPATYGLVIFAGPTLKQVAQAQVTVGNAQTAQGGGTTPGGTAPGGTTPGGTNPGGTSPGGTTPGGVVVSARFVDTTTGKPIAGALFFALVPGTDPATWFKNPVDSEVAAYGQSGADGRFTANAPLATGKTYPVVLYAKGYTARAANLTVDQSTKADFGDIGLAPAGN